MDKAVTAQASSPQLLETRGFNPNAWDHWLLLGVALVFSAWVLRTSMQWRRDWRQHGGERKASRLGEQKLS